MTTAALARLGRSKLESEVLLGLTARPKTLPPWLFYDAAGSELFEEITELPEYYLTRTERKILSHHAAAILARAAGDRRLEILELGAGTATKTGLLLAAAVQRQQRVVYRAIDVSSTALECAKSRLEREIPGVKVEPVVADFTVSLESIGHNQRSGAAPCRLVLFIGSSLGNFDPAEAGVLLRSIRAELEPGDALLLGLDMVKAPASLVAAYDDRAGVTARFNKNILSRINRELDADFNLSQFRHRALWNPMQTRMEMHLESLTEQRITIEALDLEVELRSGETIHTENSYKFTAERAASLLHHAQFQMAGQWFDSRSRFGVFLSVAG